MLMKNYIYALSAESIILLRYLLGEKNCIYGEKIITRNRFFFGYKLVVRVLIFLFFSCLTSQLSVTKDI